MAINREQKEVLVGDLRKNFSESEASFVVGVQGVTVEKKLESLRKTLRKEGNALKVAKVRLMKLALKDAGEVKGLEPFLTQQVAVVFARKEPAAVAKHLFKFASDNQKFDIHAGYMDNAILSKEVVQAIAMLPSRQVLIAELLATMMAPVTSVVMVLKALEEKKINK